MSTTSMTSLSALRPTQRVTRQRPTTKPDIRLKSSAAAVPVPDIIGRAENVEYQLIDSRRRRVDQYTPDVASTTARRIQHNDVTTTDSSSSFGWNTGIDALGDASGSITSTVPYGQSVSVDSASLLQTTGSHFSASGSFELGTTAMRRVPAGHMTFSGNADIGLITAGIPSTATNPPARRFDSSIIDALHNTFSMRVDVTASSNDVIPEVDSKPSSSSRELYSKTTNESSVNGDSVLYSFGSALPSKRSSLIVVDSLSKPELREPDGENTTVVINNVTGAATHRTTNELSAENVHNTSASNRLPIAQVNYTTEQTATSALTLDYLPTGGVGQSGDRVGNQPIDGTTITIVVCTACVLLILAPVLLCVLTRRRICNRRTSCQLRNDTQICANRKRKLMANGFSDCARAAAGLATDDDRPFKRPVFPPEAESAGCNINGIGSRSVFPFTVDEVPANRGRLKRYRTGAGDIRELERLRQSSDDWGTPPPSYRQLMAPGSPPIVSAIGCRGKALPVKRFRVPLFLGGNGSDLTSSPKIYDLIPEPPPPPLPPRGPRGHFVPESNERNCNVISTPQTVKHQGTQVADHSYGFLTRSEHIATDSLPQEIRLPNVKAVQPIADEKRFHSRLQGQGQCSQAGRGPRRPLPRIPCDVVRSPFPDVIDAAVFPQDVVSDSSVDKQRKRFPKMGRSGLMDSIRSRQSIAATCCSPTSDVISSCCSPVITSPILAYAPQTAVPPQAPLCNDICGEAKPELDWTPLRQLLGQQSTTV